MKIKQVLPLLTLTILFAACQKDESLELPPSGKATNQYSSVYIENYYNLLCRISQATPGFFPPQVARAYGYIGITNYEAVVNGIRGGSSLGGQLNGLLASAIPKTEIGKIYNWSVSSNAAIADIMRKMFSINITPGSTASLDSMEAATLAALSVSEDAEVITRSIKFGKDIAGAIYQYSTTDGGHQSYLDPFQMPYNVPADSFCWIPTGPALHPISPNWGKNRPFLLADIRNTQPEAPPAFSIDTASLFYKEALSVYNQVKINTPDQKEIAKYWADDPFNTCTPTGHTFNILSQLLRETNATLEKTSVAYAHLSIAENDAFISCWAGKYKYVLIRPVSYIKKYMDPSFNTVIGTPPFPAYTSGHSCEMGAGSRVFVNMFTDGTGNYQFTDYSQLQFGFQPRNYSNFNTLADECAMSRFYGGIHFPMDNNKGLVIGRAIGDNVNKLISWPANVK